MIKVNKKILKRFLAIMDDYNEFVFGSEEMIRKQLEICLNSQGYWSGCHIRVYYDKELDDFLIESKF
ncbi:MAG: hypothetical protein IKN65_00265 [Clostridia bacterium]|nr:hypothetical protein [Bacilli bacterium]MBR3672717.1 hypothetical protein [Clostridia bacterium]MBR4671591.1 hypothetical protein [Bacilli bacterium]